MYTSVIVVCSSQGAESKEGFQIVSLHPNPKPMQTKNSPKGSRPCDTAEKNKTGTAINKEQQAAMASARSCKLKESITMGLNITVLNKWGYCTGIGPLPRMLSVIVGGFL